MLIGHRIKFVYAAVATVANSQTGLCMPQLPQLPIKFVHAAVTLGGRGFRLAARLAANWCQCWRAVS